MVPCSLVNLLELFLKFGGKVDIEYKDRAKAIFMCLRGDLELNLRLRSSKLLPKDFLAMNPKDLATREQKEFIKKAEEDAVNA